MSQQLIVNFGRAVARFLDSYHLLEQEKVNLAYEFLSLPTRVEETAHLVLKSGVM